MICENVNGKKLLWEFTINNGNTGIMRISDPLLDTEERAEERAMSEFLRNAFAINSIGFTTYLTDLMLNNIIIVGGLNYLVKGISVAVTEISVVVGIEGVRYD